MMEVYVLSASLAAFAYPSCPAEVYNSILLLRNFSLKYLLISKSHFPSQWFMYVCGEK